MGWFSVIINPEIIPNNKKYKCNKYVMRYLVYERSLPILSIDGEDYYFTDNDLLKECLEEMPIVIRILSRL